jgi:hypothetical protein
MKKQVKKMVLAKETLRSLEELALVRGGTGQATGSCVETDCFHDEGYITQVGC